MTKLAQLTLREIRSLWAGYYVELFGAGLVEDDNGGECWAYNVLVWHCADDAVDDDGTNAVARYLIPQSAI